MSCTGPYHCVYLINATQHEWTIEHGPGHLMPILDHSRVLMTKIIPLCSFWGLPGTMLFCIAQSPPPHPIPPQHYYADVAGQHATCWRYTGNPNVVSNTWSAFQMGQKVSPTPERNDRIRAVPMLSPQPRIPELPPKSPLPHNHTQKVTSGLSAL